MWDTDKKPASYQDYAEEAARLEREELLTDAAFIWMCAAHHANKPENKHWAESRSDFCNIWAIKEVA